jgi:hypothetical protein
MTAMRNFCTRCGNPRSAQASTCQHCGEQYDPARIETETVEVARPEAASPPAEQPEEYWLGAPATFAEPTLHVEPPTLADQGIPVYRDPQPTSWDYGAPRSPALGNPGRGDSAPPSWAGFGYYEEPQRLPAEGGEPFWGSFQGSPATPQPDLAAPPYRETAGYPQAQYPQSQHQQAQYSQQPLAQPAPRQPASHRLVPAHPAPRGREQPPSRWSLSGRPSGTLIAAAALLVLACGGGAYAAVTAFTGHSGKAGGHPAVAGGVLTPAARSSTLPATAPASTPPATSPPVSTNPPSTSPPPASTPPAVPGAGSVAVSGAAQSNSAEPQVLAWVESYFTAINAHDYQAYVSLLGPQLAANVTPAGFTQGFGSTHDSGATLTAIADQGGGGEAATVTFTSHQDPSQSVNGQDSCDQWTITLFLVPGGSGYAQVPPPSGSGYASSHQACLGEVVLPVAPGPDPVAGVLPSPALLSLPLP